MAVDPSNILDALSIGNDPRVNSQLRQRIALQMMLGGKNKGYPKNVGEGLTAVGDALGEIGMARRLEQADLAQQGIRPPAAAGGAAGYSEEPTAAVPDIVPDQPAAAAPLPADTGQPAADMLSPAAEPSTAMMQPDMGGGGLGSPAPLQPTQQQANSLMNPAPTLPQQAPMPATGQFEPGPTDAPPPGVVPPSPQANEVRNRAAAILARQGGPQQNPMAAGVMPRLLAQGDSQSASPALPTGRGGAEPDARLALNATPVPGNVPVQPLPPGLRRAPPLPPTIRPEPRVQTAQAAPPQQQLYPAGYVPPEPSAPRGAPIIPPTRREVQLQSWLAANQGNPYAAMKVAPELQALQNARSTRQNEANELFKAEIARGTTQASKRIEAQVGQAEAIQKWKTGEQGIITGAVHVQPNDPHIGTPKSRQRSGVPELGPVPIGSTPKEWSDKQTPEIVKDVAAVYKAVPQFAEAIKALKQAQEHPGRAWGVGATATLAQSIPGTSAYALGQLMKQIEGKNFLTAYSTLKGGGNVNVIEGEKAQQAQARLSTAQSKEDWDLAMRDLETALRSDLEVVQRKVNRPVTAWQHSHDDDYAPDLTQRGMRHGRPAEYMGGNPALDSSYRFLK